MPCYDQRDSVRTETVYKTGISPEELAAERDRGNRFEGAVCAIVNELDRRCIAEEVLAEASRKGQIDLMSIWVTHKKNDVARLTADIHRRYSVDEQQVIKKLLGA